MYDLVLVFVDEGMIGEAVGDLAVETERSLVSPALCDVLNVVPRVNRRLGAQSSRSPGRDERKTAEIDAHVGDVHGDDGLGGVDGRDVAGEVIGAGIVDRERRVRRVEWRAGIDVFQRFHRGGWRAGRRKGAGAGLRSEARDLGNENEEEDEELASSC